MEGFLFFRYFAWHFFHAPREILRAWSNILWFNLNYFSVLPLLQTFFAPWRRITWEYGRGFDVGRYLFVFASNLISRILGAIMRSFLIGIGLTLEIGLIVLGLLLLFCWLLLPAFIGGAFFYGVFLLI